MDGMFVQDIEIGFHELLLPMCLINSSYDGLNFEEQQQKIHMIQSRMQDYTEVPDRRTAFGSVFQ